MKDGARAALADWRRRLRGQNGQRYWRSLEELIDSPSFAERLREEFPMIAGACEAAPDRRRFLQLMAASLALAGVGGCGPEPDSRDLIPYVEAPEGVVPSRFRHYATATTLDGFATGVLLAHYMARPIKVDGNPHHPASLGGSSAIMQASVLELYDPHRSQAITRRGEAQSWEQLVAMLIERRRSFAADHGAGLRLLTGAVTSPTLLAQIAALREEWPELRWHQWEPLSRDAVRGAAQQFWGGPVEVIYDFTKADVIVAIESDFLSYAPGHLRYARDFAARRRPAETGVEMSRLYALESTPTLVGAKADHRFVLSPAEIGAAMRFLAARLETSGEAGAAPPAPWLGAVAEDLARHRGRVVVHVGREQPGETHLLAHAINAKLGAVGATVIALEPIEAEPVDHGRSLAALVADMEAGKVETLIMMGVNPAYAAPSTLGFVEALRRVPLSLHLGLYADETAAVAQWHLPMTHEYESWSDARAYDGTATILQPQLRPPATRCSPHRLLAVLAGETQPNDEAILRRYWVGRRGGGDFESFWREALRLGVVPETAARPVEHSPTPPIAAAPVAASGGGSGGTTVLFRPDSALWDGRFANNGWLQELPRAFTQLTWGNAALIAPATAARLGISVEGTEPKTAELIEIKIGDRQVQAPAWVLPGQAPDCVTLTLGFGRRQAGPVGSDIGYDAFALRPGDEAWSGAGATLRRIGARVQLATTQGHHFVAGRDLVREGTLAQYREDPHFLATAASAASLYPEYAYDREAWGMAINLNSCIGCGACVAACQAENNIPVVGKAEVLREREMHWLRVDLYYAGEIDRPRMVFQPVPCMHCEHAPCEVVCPVQATVHDSYGLNVMVYNRCVGTRFCSNNCPYKVRRFNFFDFSGAEGRPRDSWNPIVSVRGRGVMEKCTYCVQRIRTAQIDADREGRNVAEGEVVTACQAACPTQAIVFGDKNNPDSAVSKRKASPLDYVLMEELNTRPRTSYEAEIRNPNPALEPSA